MSSSLSVSRQTNDTRADQLAHQLTGYLSDGLKGGLIEQGSN